MILILAIGRQSQTKVAGLVQMCNVDVTDMHIQVGHRLLTKRSIIQARIIQLVLSVGNQKNHVLVRDELYDTVFGQVTYQTMLFATCLPQRSTFL